VESGKAENRVGAYRFWQFGFWKVECSLHSTKMETLQHFKVFWFNALDAINRYHLPHSELSTWPS
jgi:hypothetical protein